MFTLCPRPAGWVLEQVASRALWAQCLVCRVPRVGTRIIAGFQRAAIFEALGTVPAGDTLPGSTVGEGRLPEPHWPHTGLWALHLHTVGASGSVVGTGVGCGSKRVNRMAFASWFQQAAWRVTGLPNLCSPSSSACPHPGDPWCPLATVSTKRGGTPPPAPQYMVRVIKIGNRNTCKLHGHHFSDY